MYNKCSGIKTLNDLFEVWREKHYLENSVSCQNTFPEMPQYLRENYGELDIAMFKNNWTIDGCLSDEVKCEILFVLKESNIEGLEDQKFIIKHPIFWIKDNKTNYRKTIPRRLKKLTVKLMGKKCDYDWYRYAAVININKRGGFSKCNINRILNYAEEYSDMINTQIEILNPKIIVFLGSEFSDKYDRLTEFIDFRNRKVYISYHPAYKGVKNSFTDDMFVNTIKIIKNH